MHHWLPVFVLILVFAACSNRKTKDSKTEEKENEMTLSFEANGGALIFLDLHATTRLTPAQAQSFVKMQNDRLANANIKGVAKLINGESQLEIRIARSSPQIDNSIPKTKYLKAIQFELEPTVEQAIFALTRKSHLELMILADEDEDDDLVANAFKSKQNSVFDNETKIGQWVLLPFNNKNQLRIPPKNAILRIANSTQRIDLGDRMTKQDWETSFAELVDEKYPDKEIQVLAKIVDEQRRVTDEDTVKFEVNSTKSDQHFLDFEVTRQAVARLSRLTGHHINRDLAIVVDGRLLNASNINTKIWKNVSVEGDFSDDEIEFINTQLRFSLQIEVDEDGTTTYHLPKSIE